MRLLPLLPSGPDGICNYPVRRTQLSLMTAEDRQRPLFRAKIKIACCQSNGSSYNLPVNFPANLSLRLRRSVKSRQNFCLKLRRRRLRFSAFAEGEITPCFLQRKKHGGERGIRTLGTSLPAHTISNRAPSTSSGISP
jgi:hypothetical protein